MTILRFPTERSAGCKRDAALEELQAALRDWHIDKAIERFERLAAFRRRYQAAR